jgi:hypothetical protein
MPGLNGNISQWMIEQRLLVAHLRRILDERLLTVPPPSHIWELSLIVSRLGPSTQIFRVMSTKCTECGALIDTAADIPDAPVPCPYCGGIRRTVQFSATGGRLSNYALDNFVAHKLSLLTECGAREIPTYANYLNTFILNSVFRVTPR